MEKSEHVMLLVTVPEQFVKLQGLEIVEILNISGQKTVGNPSKSKRIRKIKIKKKIQKNYHHCLKIWEKIQFGNLRRNSGRMINKNMEKWRCTGVVRELILMKM